MIGGSLLLGAIRNVMGPAHAGQGALDPGVAGDSNSPWGGGSKADSDLARQAGLDDVGGRQASAYDDGERDAYDQDAADDTDDSDYDEIGRGLRLRVPEHRDHRFQSIVITGSRGS